MHLNADPSVLVERLSLRTVCSARGRHSANIRWENIWEVTLPSRAVGCVHVWGSGRALSSPTQAAAGTVPCLHLCTTTVPSWSREALVEWQWRAVCGPKTLQTVWTAFCSKVSQTSLSPHNYIEGRKVQFYFFLLSCHSMGWFNSHTWLF
jgi:hypothetical protein